MLSLSRKKMVFVLITFLIRFSLIIFTFDKRQNCLRCLSKTVQFHQSQNDLEDKNKKIPSFIMQKYFSFLIIQTCLVFAQAWFESCDNNHSVSATSTLIVTHSNYPTLYQPGSSCKWYLSAPTGYTIELSCTFNVYTYSSNCPSQRVYVSRDGDRDLNYSEYYCGYSNFTRTSVGNEITFGYTSNTDGNGWLYCEAKAILTTQANCQCGWSKSVRDAINVCGELKF